MRFQSLLLEQQAPKAMDVKAKLDGSDVILSWTGQSDEWAMFTMEK